MQDRMWEMGLRILFVICAIIEGLAHSSEGTRLGDQRWKTPWRLGGEELLSHWRSPYYHRVVDDFVDDFSPALNAIHGRQLEQTTPNGEVEALLAFKLGVTNDPLNVLSSWNSNDSDPCHWNGVTCSQASKRVITLDLNEMLLTGTISPGLGALTYLQRVNLSANSFQGEIPTSLLNCSRLTYLALRDNNFGGTIPSQVGELLNLELLDLSNNLLLGGKIPNSLGNCSYLQVLHLDFTTVFGEIPSTFGQLSRLESLNLSQTLNSGTIPKSLGNCSALTYLDLGNLYPNPFVVNQLNTSISGELLSGSLSGELPAELGQLTRLENFGISGSNIVGSFPGWIANLTQLTGILFINTFFTGEIPQFLGTLPLEILGLSSTNFTGTIPGAISNCSNLWFLTIEENPLLTGAMPEVGMLQLLGSLSFLNNNLTGKIPPSTSNCSRLRTLRLGGSLFLDRQPFPSWVANFVNLTLLVLTNANLVGAIPASLGQIPKLDTLLLYDNKLSGQIPSSLGNCTSLSNLELNQNSLVGDVPSDVWNLTQLTKLLIYTNFLSGAIPAAIGKLSQLEYLVCAGNLFSGPIPPEMGNLSENLILIELGSNNFSGSIPQSIGNCSALLYLSIVDNRLTGSLPTSLGNLTALQQLTLYGNQLEGQIPVDLMKCTQLNYLDLSQNLLVERVPEDIGQLASLQTLYLQQNQLAGSIPVSLGFCQNLIYIDFSFNKLTGAIPGDPIGNISGSLYALNLSSNLFSGSLPPELQELTELVFLNLSGNNFSGSIPSGLGFCKDLQSLDISLNNLSGGIPQTIGLIQSLDFVNMSYNHLQGPLPSGGIFNSSNISAKSFLGNPGLCGNLLLKDCPLAPSPSNESHCKGFQCDHGGVALVSVGAAVVLIVLGGIICKVAYNWWLADHGQELFQQGELEMGLTLSEQELTTLVALPENLIGVGGRSTIYKAILRDGMTVAIKVLSSGGRDNTGGLLAEDELYREANALSKIRHRNIVKVLGLFSNPRITAMYLEYMPNGSLHKHLFEVEDRILRWEARLKIAIGVADGLFYLHSQVEEPMIHRDLKASNVLLDADLEAKLCDFGISRFVKVMDVGEATTSKVHGTMGYIPPEYGTTNKVSTKGDVYNYGVMLLELLARKPSIVADYRDNVSGQQTPTHIVNWILEVTKENPLAGIDTMLLTNSCSETSSKDIVHREQMKLLLQVALLCTQNKPHQRPDMSNVVAMLRKIQEKGLDLPDRPTIEELAAEISDFHTPDHVNI